MMKRDLEYFVSFCPKLKSTRNFPLHNFLQSKNNNRNMLRKTSSLTDSLLTFYRVKRLIVVKSLAKL